MKTSKALIRIVAVTCIGGGLEMYDFMIYAFFAPILAALFFPNTNHLVSLIEVFSVFAAGYLARPLGAIFFGHYGDKKGRKKGLLLTIIIMAIATGLMGLLPTYAMVGIWAPIGLVFLRCLQGFAVGGDLPGAITFINEHAPNQKRGFLCSLVMCGVNLGLLLASFISVLTSLLSHAELISWGWRLGFILGMGIAFLGYYLRRKISDTPYFLQLAADPSQQVKAPVAFLFKHYSWKILQGFAMVWLFSITIGLFIYLPSYLQTILHFTSKFALPLSSVSILLFALSIPLWGLLSDNIGHKTLHIVIAILFIILAYPLYKLIASNDLTLQITALFMLSILSGALPGNATTLLAELFVTKIRYSGVGVAYNLNVILGGFTPLIATYLIYHFHLVEAPSFYLILGALISLLAGLTVQDKTQQALPD